MQIMKRILALVLMLSASSAWAEWTKMFEMESRTKYLDLSTIRHSGHLVKVWELDDYKTLQTVGGISYLSTKVQMQYDCQEENIRTLAFSLFSKNMGNGKLIDSSFVHQEWIPVQPESAGEALFKALCDKM